MITITFDESHPHFSGQSYLVDDDTDLSNFVRSSKIAPGIFEAKWGGYRLVQDAPKQEEMTCLIDACELKIKALTLLKLRLEDSNG